MSTKRLIMTTPLTEKIYTALQENGESISGFTNTAIENELLPRTQILRDAAETVISGDADVQGYNEAVYEDVTNLLELALRWLSDHHIQSSDVLWKIFQYVPRDVTFSEDAVNEAFEMDKEDQKFSDFLYEELEKNPNYRKPRNRDSRTLLKDLLANWKYVWDSPRVYAYLDEVFFMESTSPHPGDPEATPLQAVRWVKELEEEYISEQL